MMNLRACVLAISLWATGLSVATVEITPFVLSENDPAGPPPAGFIIAEVYADLSGADTWSMGAIFGETQRGALLHYARDNNGDPVVINPGADNRYVTCLSRPRDRVGDDRYEDADAVLGGRYWPGAADTFSETLINTTFMPAPGGGPQQQDGHIIRIALDVRNLTIGGPFPNSDFAAFRLGQEPAGALSIFESRYPATTGSPGTASASFDVPAPAGINWGVFYVPEPASITLLLIGAVSLRRLR